MLLKLLKAGIVQPDLDYDKKVNGFTGVQETKEERVVDEVYIFRAL